MKEILVRIPGQPEFRKQYDSSVRVVRALGQLDRAGSVVGRIAETNERNTDGESYESLAIDRVEGGQRSPIVSFAIQLRLRCARGSTRFVERQWGESSDNQREGMQPLQDLLHRIMWDPEYGKGRFALGYEDRMVPQEKVVLFAIVRFDPKRPGTFSIHQEDGSVAHIPLHRVRTVYKNGEVIWRRPDRAPRG